MGKLLDFFEAVVGTKYDPNSLSDRIEIQKVVYLGEAIGLNLGSYLFVRKDRGPYSLTLRLDVLDEIDANPPPPPTVFTEFAQSAIAEIHGLVNYECNDATLYEKHELAASLHYLGLNDCRYQSKEEIIDELLSWKKDYVDYGDKRFNLDAAWEKVAPLIS